MCRTSSHMSLQFVQSGEETEDSLFGSCECVFCGIWNEMVFFTIICSRGGDFLWINCNSAISILSVFLNRPPYHFLVHLLI